MTRKTTLICSDTGKSRVCLSLVMAGIIATAQLAAVAVEIALR